jgi:hypothetical protein
MALESINNKCWAIMDWLWDCHIPIGAPFEKFRLPPILFPLLIILIALLLVWLAFPGMLASSSPSCGDGICSPPEETCQNCPIDCGTCEANLSGGLIVTVDIIGPVSEPVTVKLLDKDGSTLQSETGRKNAFEFTGVTPQIIQASASCPNGNKQDSRPRQVDQSSSSISLLLPEKCFDYINDINNNPMATNGNLVVQVTDSITGLPLDGATITAVRSSDDLPEKTSLSEDGEATLHVRSDNFYYLMASMPGYTGYSGKSDRFFMAAGDTIFKTISLDSFQPPEASGRVRVCARSSSDPLSSGNINIIESGTQLRSTSLNPSDNGCITFELPGGKVVRATMSPVPAGCVSPGFSNEVTVNPNSERDIELSLSCGEDVAYVKVIVHDRQGRTVTDQLQITLWNAVTRKQITGSAPDGTLSMGSSGYTEELIVPANTLIQAKAAGAPLGFVDTASGPAAFIAGERGSIDIILGETSRGQFSFQGASLIYTPATPGNPVQVFVQQILYDQTVLTPQNSDVVVIINGDEYNATYLPSTI